VTRDTLTYTGGALIGFVLALVNVAVVTHFLSPGEFGQLALLLTFAAFLTVFYNLGTLQGIFMWVFGSSGEEEVDDSEQSAAGSKRKALGSGVVFTATIATLGTAAVAAVAPQMADLVLGDRSKGNLILIAALSGAAGALWRLVGNILRMERKPRPYVVLNTVRPILVTGSVIPLVAAGGGVEAAIVGTTIGSWISVVVGLLATRKSFALSAGRGDMLMFIRRGGVYVPIILSFWVAQNVDLFALSKFAPDVEVGLYRLATRIGAFVSYFSSALFMAWTPLRDTSTFMAAERERGRELLGGTFLSYFVLGGTLLVLAVTVAADTLVRIAPPAYANAAPLIPVVAAGFLAHGLLVALYRVTSFPRRRFVYGVSAIVAATVFLVAALWLIPWLDAYGAALSVILGFLAGAALLGIASQRGPEPLPIQYRRIAIGIALAGGCLIVGRGLGALLGAWGPAIEIATLVLYPVLLAISGVVPLEEMKAIWAVVRAAVSRPRKRDVDTELRTLPPEDVAFLQKAVSLRWQVATMAADLGSDASEIGADLVRLLRRLDGSELTTDQDQRIGAYLFAEIPVAERDAIGRDLWSTEVDPADVHRLERTQVDLGRVEQEVWDECTASLAPTGTLSHRRNRRIWPRRRRP